MPQTNSRTFHLDVVEEVMRNRAHFIEAADTVALKDNPKTTKLYLNGMEFFSVHKVTNKVRNAGNMTQWWLYLGLHLKKS